MAVDQLSTYFCLYQGIVHGGALHALYMDYKDKADIILVYILEAHSTEGWKMGTTFSDAKQPITIEERIDRARDLLYIIPDTVTSDPYDTSKVRVVVDDMDNKFDETFWCWPDRSLAIKDGQLAFTGRNIVQQMKTPDKLLTTDLREWMEAQNE
ncbi:type I iodothyronine deiodinase-like [Saccoglossus kowalevskii]